MGNELYHFGIKGQKWGVRRFQNPDGSLTPAGRKRYDVDIQGAKENLKTAKANEKAANQEYNRKTRGGIIYNKTAADKLAKSVNETRWAKEDLKGEKIKIKLNKEKDTSERRKNLEQLYRDKGMSEEEAAVAAYKRELTERVLAASAGITLAAVTAYGAYKLYDKNVDKVIKTGTVLQNIAGRDNKGVNNPFYASLTKMDNIKYRGMYGDQIKKAGRDVFESKIKVDQNLKIASEKNAVKALQELVKNDPDYAQKLEKHLRDAKNSMPFFMPKKQLDAAEKGYEALKKGQINSKVYEALNLSLVDHHLSTSADVNKGFYDQLKSKGYDAIIDVNDKKLSGFMSDKPVIVFNGSNKLTVDAVRQVGDAEIEKAKKKGMLDITVKSLAPELAIYTAAGVGIKGAVDVANTKSDEKIVRDYRKKHPDTELTYKEILRNHGK